MANTKIKECTLEFEISTEGPPGLRSDQTVTLSFNSQSHPPWRAQLCTPMSKPSDYSAETLGGLVRETRDAPAVQKIVQSLARKPQTKAFAKFTRELNNNN